MPKLIKPSTPTDKLRVLNQTYVSYKDIAILFDCSKTYASTFKQELSKEEGNVCKWNNYQVTLSSVLDKMGIGKEDFVDQLLNQIKYMTLVNDLEKNRKSI